MGRRKKGAPPKLCCHKGKNLAYVTVNGRPVYLGVWGSAEAAKGYKQFIGEWERQHRTEMKVETTGKRCTVADLIGSHFLHAQTHYRRKDGSLTDEIRAFKKSLEPVLAEFGDISPDDFEPKDLRKIINAWVDAGHCRETVNKMAGRIKRVFSWGVEQQLVDAVVAGALRTVRGLQSGRTPAPDYEEVLPVGVNDLAATLRHCAPVVEAMIRTQYYCGCRPGEVVVMRAEEIHRKEFRAGKRTIVLPSGVWAFLPSQHKTLLRGKFVRYLIGPKLQRILAPWIAQADQHDGHLFPSTVLQHWRVDTFNEALDRACDEAGVPRWTPGQLRHSFLNRISQQYGIVAAQEAVCHAHLSTTQIYVEQDVQRTAAIAAKHG